MKNKLENIFLYFAMSNKMSSKNNLLIFFFKFIKIIRNKYYKIKGWKMMELKK
jgi:hypothetical protein